MDGVITEKIDDQQYQRRRRVWRRKLSRGAAQRVINYEKARGMWRQREYHGGAL